MDKGDRARGDRPRILANTYSIVARDSVTGEMGVAVQSHWFSVGSVVVWGEAGVGVVATQAMVNPALGPQGLELMKGGMTPRQAMSTLLAADGGREVRQVAFLDHRGRVAAHTGKCCIACAGHLVGKGFSVQANMMHNDRVWPSMYQAFTESDGPLAERLLLALEAAERAGGDIRGKQSAALLVVRKKSTGRPWEDRLVDLRVEDAREPLVELRRLLQVHRAYEHMNLGDLAMEKGDMPGAKEHYSIAESMFPESEEIAFWHAITLLNNGKQRQARPILRQVLQRNPDYAELARRLVPAGLLLIDPQLLERMLAAAVKA